MSVTKELTLSEFRQYLRGLPEALNAAAVRGIRTGAHRAIDVARQAGDAAPPASINGEKGAFDTGAYRRGWRVKPIDGGAELGNYSGHADVVEKGRHQNRRFPPLKVIARWAVRRLGLSEEEAKLAAFPMARAIARRGLFGRYVLGGARAEIVRVVFEEVKTSIGEALRGGHSHR